MHNCPLTVKRAFTPQSRTFVGSFKTSLSKFDWHLIAEFFLIFSEFRKKKEAVLHTQSLNCIWSIFWMYSNQYMSFLFIHNQLLYRKLSTYKPLNWITINWIIRLLKSFLCWLVKSHLKSPSLFRYWIKHENVTLSSKVIMNLDFSILS